MKTIFKTVIIIVTLLLPMTIGASEKYKDLIVGKWDIVYSGNHKPVHTCVEFKSDGTFSYTSKDDVNYEEHGKYRVQGDILYELFSDEDEWYMNQITLLDPISLIFQEYYDDIGLSNIVYAYQKENPEPPKETNPLIVGKWKLFGAGAIATHVEFLSDGTFFYYSTKDPGYKDDYGIYRIEGDILYGLPFDEDLWCMSRIKTLDSSKMIAADLYEDAVSEWRTVTYIKDDDSVNPNTESVVTVDGIRYKILSDSECEVDKNVKISGELTIPAIISYDGKKYKITSIGDNAFAYSKSLTSIKIPNSVTKIGTEAFKKCSSLTSITIPNSVASVGGDAFRKTAWYDNLPEGLVYVGKVAYRYKGTMPMNTEIVLRDGTLSISDGAFSNCRGLTSVTIPNSVTTIGRIAFYECTSLSSVTIPNSVTSIGMGAFNGIDMSSVVSLIENPFRIDGKDDNDYFGYSTFSENSFNNATLYVPIGTIDKYKSTGGWKDFKNIKEGNKSPDNKTYTLSITAMGNGSASYNGTNVINSTKTFSVKEGATAKVLFNPDDGYQIARATMNGRNIVDLSTMSFTIDIMDEDVTIEVEFEAIPEGKEKCGAAVYYSYDETTKTLTISGNGNMSDYDDDHNKAPWSSYASEIQKIKIGSGITNIGNFTFYKCRNITSLTIPSAVTSIGSSAFESCTGLTSLTLSDGLESIGGSAFESCTGLKNLVIPSTVNTISINAFRNCKGITDVYCYAENVPTTDENAFNGTPTEKSRLHVPANAIEAYKAAWPWSDFKEIVALTNNPDGILEIKQLDDSQVPYYDLYGRRIHQPLQKGLYIQNGRKIIVN